jgi:hypothetical protein
MNFEIAPKSTEIQTNWDDAKLYCFSLNIDGKTGWRLPTKEELNEIYQSENDFENNWYWSSTEYSSTEYDGIFVWYQNMSNGVQYNRTKNGSYYVRAIRSIT